MTRFLSAVALFALAAARATAQVEAEIALERENLLVYEPIRVLVQVSNSSGQPLDLARSSGSHPWLDLFVTRADDTSVPRTAKSWEAPHFLVMAGKKQTLAVDILPVFQVREPGEYRIHARVFHAGGSIASRVLHLTVDRGTTVWKQQVSLPPDPSDPSGAPRSRLYTLLVHRVDERRELFARIQDPQQERVYCTSRTGTFVNSSDMEARVDREGTLHVLQRAGARIFRCSRFTAAGKALPQRLFSDMGSPPRLVSLANDAVDVVGGEEVVLESKDEKGDQIIPTAPVGQPPRDRSLPPANREGF